MMSDKAATGIQVSWGRLVVGAGHLIRRARRDRADRCRRIGAAGDRGSSGETTIGLARNAAIGGAGGGAVRAAALGRARRVVHGAGCLIGCTIGGCVVRVVCARCIGLRDCRRTKECDASRQERRHDQIATGCSHGLWFSSGSRFPLALARAWGARGKASILTEVSAALRGAQLFANCPLPLSPGVRKPVPEKEMSAGTRSSNSPAYIIRIRIIGGAYAASEHGR